jgi:hypothetical protein
MLNLKVSACLDAPVERVWAVLSDLAAIQEWVGAIQHVYCPAQARGVGALRICELKPARIEETMLASATNRWMVAAHGDQTLVTSVAESTIKRPRRITEV